MQKLNQEAAKAALNIIANKNYRLYEGGDKTKILAIWAAAIADDLPAETAKEIAIRVCGKTKIPDVSDINEEWAKIKHERIRDTFEPDPPPEITGNPVAYLEYRKTWARSIALGNTQGIAHRTAIEKAKTYIGITAK